MIIIFEFNLWTCLYCQRSLVSALLLSILNLRNRFALCTLILNLSRSYNANILTSVYSVCTENTPPPSAESFHCGGFGNSVRTSLLWSPSVRFFSYPSHYFPASLLSTLLPHHCPQYTPSIIATIWPVHLLIWARRSTWMVVWTSTWRPCRRRQQRSRRETVSPMSREVLFPSIYVVLDRDGNRVMQEFMIQFVCLPSICDNQLIYTRS